MGKPPAFQFYTKDWRSSPTICRMTQVEKGTAVDLMALSWDSPVQGVILADPWKLSQLTGVHHGTIRHFLKKYPQFFEPLTVLYDEFREYLEGCDLREFHASFTRVSREFYASFTVEFACFLANRKMLAQAAKLHQMRKKREGWGAEKFSTNSTTDTAIAIARQVPSIHEVSNYEHREDQRGAKPTVAEVVERAFRRMAAERKRGKGGSV